MSKGTSRTWQGLAKKQNMTYSLHQNKVDFGREILTQVAGGSYLSALHGSAQPRNEHVLSNVGLNSGITRTIGEGQKVTVWGRGRVGMCVTSVLEMAGGGLQRPVASSNGGFNVMFSGLKCIGGSLMSAITTRSFCWALMLV